MDKGEKKKKTPKTVKTGKAKSPDPNKPDPKPTPTSTSTKTKIKKKEQARANLGQAGGVRFRAHTLCDQAGCAQTTAQKLASCLKTAPS